MKQIPLFIIVIAVFSINLGFSQQIEQVKNPFILILDIQDQFYKNKPIAPRAAEMIGVINPLLQSFPPERIIYIESFARVLSVSLKGIRVDTLPFTGLDPALNILSDNIFRKSGGNAFASGGIKEYLEKGRATNIVITGLLADGCVYKTALGGKELGYEVYVIPEAIIGSTSKKKEKALRKMEKAGIGVITLGEFHKLLGTS